ncbi:MAG: hypothetical protein GTN81_00640 [Proteobacteria bacterium]|nr:hypothetical protein [Pseudomonadota bacterium]
MARPLRIEYQGAFYHITARGNEKRAIFRENRDYDRFLILLGRMHERYGIQIHAYVLMPNHYHLLMETPQGNLVAIMHDLNTAYTNYFNKKYERVGHLFQGRYRGILVDRDPYLLELSRYIHLNPVRAGIVQSPEKYRWSSYIGYISSKSAQEWLFTDLVLAQVGADLRKAQKAYRGFVERGLREEISDPLQEAIHGVVIGGAEFWQKVKDRFLETSKDQEIPRLREIHQRRDLEAIVERVATFYDVSRYRILRKERPAHHATQVAIYLCRKKTDLSLKEIGTFFGNRHYTAVSVAHRRVEERRQSDSRFDQELKQIEKEVS